MVLGKMVVVEVMLIRCITFICSNGVVVGLLLEVAFLKLKGRTGENDYLDGALISFVALALSVTCPPWLKKC